MKDFNNRIGEENINNQGLKMKIINYRKYNDIDIQFEDNYISYNKSYRDFKLGKIKNNNYKNSNIIDRSGEINYNTYGSKMTIIKYNKRDDIIVEFENKYKIKTDYKSFKKGHVRNPYDKTVYKHGYLGEGEYVFFINKKPTLQYKYWESMLMRCYGENFQKDRECYKNCNVYSEWLNFQNFSKWFDNNYYTIYNERMELDKDILFKGNKIYSPNTCVFVPHRINTLFIKSDKTRGKYPIGVDFHKTVNKYRSRCNTHINNKIKRKELGYFDTPEEAFNAYKKYKEDYIKQVADDYKDKIPQKLYDAMYNWKVEITD